jgi:hypothetical protein
MNREPADRSVPGGNWNMGDAKQSVVSPARQAMFFRLALLIVQWPLCAATLIVLAGGLRASYLDWLAWSLCLAGLICLAASRRRWPVALSWLGLLALTAGSLGVVRQVPVWAIFLIVSLLWLSVGCYLYFGGQRRAGLLARQVSLLMAGLFLLEGISQAVLQNYLHFRGVAATGRLYAPDPQMIHVLLPNSEATHSARGLFDVAYHTDALGNRLVPGQPARGPRWVCGGCSVAFGWGLNDADTIPALIQANHPELRICNHAVPGYGPADVYLRLCRDLAKGPDSAGYVYFCIDHHLLRLATNLSELSHDDTGMERPIFTLDGREPVCQGKGRDYYGTPWRQLRYNLLNRSYVVSSVFSRTEASEEAAPLFAALVRKMKAACDERHCRFVVVRLPSTYPGVSLEAAMASLAAEGIRAVDHSRRFDEYLRARNETADHYFNKGDAHPNADCALLLAQWFDEALADEKPTEPIAPSAAR